MGARLQAGDTPATPGHGALLVARCVAVIAALGASTIVASTTTAQRPAGVAPHPAQFAVDPVCADTPGYVLEDLPGLEGPPARTLRGRGAVEPRASIEILLNLAQCATIARVLASERGPIPTSEYDRGWFPWYAGTAMPGTNMVVHPRSFGPVVLNGVGSRTYLFEIPRRRSGRYACLTVTTSDPRGDADAIRELASTCELVPHTIGLTSQPTHRLRWAVLGSALAGFACMLYLAKRYDPRAF